MKIVVFPHISHLAISNLLFRIAVANLSLEVYGFNFRDFKVSD